jgi:hypothetical protein
LDEAGKIAPISKSRDARLPHVSLNRMDWSNPGIRLGRRAESALRTAASARNGAGPKSLRSASLMKLNVTASKYPPLTSVWQIVS